MIKSINDPSYQALLRWLKSVRVAEGLTVRDFAKLIKEPFQLVSKVETGQRKLSVLEYVQYCDALGLDPRIGIDILAQGTRE